MTSLLHKIIRFFWIRLNDFIEKIPWKILHLENQIHSELTLSIKNRADWNTYNEIFVRGDYNFAIEKALERFENEQIPFKFIDLGANIGFFSMKVIDTIIRQNDRHFNYEGLLVEGSPQVYKQLLKRFNKNVSFYKSLRLIQGLVGQRDGVAKIFESDNYITNSLSSRSNVRTKIAGTTVPFVDLYSLCNDDSEIDLLKCDIEGSEFDFLKNYQNLLARVKVAVFELHHDKCDTTHCISLIFGCGLINHRKIFDYGESCSLLVFWK